MIQWILASSTFRNEEVELTERWKSVVCRVVLLETREALDGLDVTNDQGKRFKLRRPDSHSNSRFGKMSRLTLRFYLVQFVFSLVA